MFNQVRQKLSGRKSVKQASLLYVSTLLGVFMGMGVSVLNTRALLPAEYGDVKYVNNFVAFFSGILLLGYFISGSRLLAIAKSKEESDRIKGATIFVLICTGIGVAFLTLLTGLFHQYILHKPFAYLFYAVLPVCLNSLLINYINTTSQGSNDIGTISAARLIPPACYLLIAGLTYHYFGATPEKMLWLHNGTAIAVYLVLLIMEKPSFIGLKSSLRALNNENKAYGLDVYLGSLVGLSIPYIAGVTLGLFAANNSNVAFYTLALTVSAPLAMAPSVIATTYFKQFANQIHISPKLIKSTMTISLLSLLGYCIVIFPLVNVLYDESYQIVAIYGCWLAVGAVSQGLGDVFNRFLGAHGQGKCLRNGAWFSGGVSLIGYTFGVWQFGIEGAIATRIIASAVYLSAMILYYRKFTSCNNYD